jgi:glutathione synthase/RimK-type ligase-like ATP-grasp enzyme
LKPHWGGGWKDVHRVDSLQELLEAYNSSGHLCMMLQEFIQWEQYVRCICVGKRKILITNWDPRKSHFERYRNVDQKLPQDLRNRIESDAIKINEALGYDMNTVEFAVRDGIPVAIDFMNSAPDFDISSLTELYFPWVVRNMSDMLIERAQQRSKAKPGTQWDQFIHS